MPFGRTLGVIALAVTLGTAGCSKQTDPPAPSRYVEGYVTKVFGSVAGLVHSSGFFSDSVKLGKPTLGIRVETPRGVYSIELKDYVGSEGNHTLLNLAGAIQEREEGKEGTRVRFPTENTPQKRRETTGFSSDRVGILDVDDIQILGY